ncbi:unnamed protein product [Eruca vesicaria subsp. sativa]|uniref:Uncharacterized protein n=1 Tax=Eruca vesicaria subsp. sativa TaxID=29727 RepID=A0ABC8L959_ERUVS|nr:unnamed protein product [Eruca vesicaria subsp. sativa]
MDDNPRRDKNNFLVMKLAFQATFHYIWKDHNTCLHPRLLQPSASIISDINPILFFLSASTQLLEDTQIACDVFMRCKRNIP